MTADKDALLREAYEAIGAIVDSGVFEAESQHYYHKLRARITDALAEKDEGWMPIETAPKDGTKIKLLCEFGEDEGFYCDYTKRDWNPSGLPGEWSTDKGNGDPTHWRPLPPLPKGDE